VGETSGCIGSGEETDCGSLSIYGTVKGSKVAETRETRNGTATDTPL
jgi:hypothetical protein